MTISFLGWPEKLIAKNLHNKKGREVLALRKSREDGIYSQKYIMDALVKLLCEYKFQDITVTDICKKAGVARVTFYKYYTSIYDVMHSSVNEKIEHFLEKITDLNPNDDLLIMIEYVIEEIIPFRKALKNFIDSNMSGILLDYFNYAMEAISNSEATGNNYMSRTQILFLAGGAFNIITDWIKGESKESPQAVAVAKRICEVLPYKTKAT